MAPSTNCLLPHALKLPGLSKLSGKRVILASNSPRRKQILETFGVAPEIVPSTFEENLPRSEFQDVHEYPVATATYKAVEVYERLVKQDPENPPDLVIGADTIVLSSILPSTTQYVDENAHHNQEILEKPETEEDNMRMLMDLNGGVCEVVTGVSIVYPILSSPGYEIKSIDERSLVYFSDNAPHLLEAYVKSKEGIDRAGGFAIQGLGALLIRKVDGDYNNVVGFPASSFFKYLELLVEEDGDFLEI
ncbi:hypothetical protein JAAARDRAFT_205959 [Jaapia argillacea MUCL 33604]|uniref:Maf/Ham1 n=1 Tax=Jaapia argillacea MUCL 33604 TaxID=933084 RepID=A0A067Q8Q9_9AGAM|nr:hypothetical protein JAAARDRAFT_205959 [Jaapia argillacea MUCL 33604]